MIAALPMYDWPEIRAETDLLWATMRDAFRSEGLDAPDALTRGEADPWAIWRAGDLRLSQTCGLPFSARLAGNVTLLGAPAYDLPGCAPGFYRSEIVVRADDPATDLADLSAARFAYNMRESQSGWACVAAQFGDPARLFGALAETGAHRASVIAVADGRADVAAIDAVAWRLALRHEPAAAKLRVLRSSAPTPGLPYIAAKARGGERDAMAGAVETAIAALDGSVKDALLLTGFTRMAAADYAPLAAGWPD